jgi:MtN3 and saliva related transmembrane protein
MAVETIGTVAAVCTTLCWVPQATQIIREQHTEGVSLATQCVFSVGVAFWCTYGLLLHSWPLILANAITLVLSLAILGLKLRYP